MNPYYRTVVDCRWCQRWDQRTGGGDPHHHQVHQPPPDQPQRLESSPKGVWRGRSVPKEEEQQQVEGVWRGRSKKRRNEGGGGGRGGQADWRGRVRSMDRELEPWADGGVRDRCSSPDRQVHSHTPVLKGSVSRDYRPPFFS